MRAKTFRDYLSDRSGNVAILATIVLPVAFVTIGVAIDMSRMHSTSRFLQDAVDNAALAAVSVEDISIDDRKDLAKESLKETRRQINRNLVIKNESVEITDDGDTATVNVSVDVPQYFGAFLGKTSRNVGNTGVATRANDGLVEPTSLIFVLDASGSMKARMGSSTRIDVLKDTIRNSFAEFGTDDRTEARLRTGVYAYNWGIRDEYSNPLSNGWSTTQTKIEDMDLWRATIPAQALEAAVSELRSEPATLGTEPRRKVIVFMTDGEVDDHLDMDGKSSIYHPYSGYNGTFTQRTLDACEAAQNAGIYVIAVSLDAPKSGRDLLQDCASSGTGGNGVFVNAVNAKKFEEAIALAMPEKSAGDVRLVR